MNKRAQWALIKRADAAGVRVSLHDSGPDRPCVIHPDGKQEVTWSELERIVVEAEGLTSGPNRRDRIFRLLDEKGCLSGVDGVATVRSAMDISEGDAMPIVLAWLALQNVRVPGRPTRPLGDAHA